MTKTIGAGLKSSPLHYFAAFFFCSFLAASVSSYLWEQDLHATRKLEETRATELASTNFSLRFELYQKTSKELHQKIRSSTREPASVKRQTVENTQKDFPRLSGLFQWSPSGNFFVWGERQLAQLPNALEEARKLLAPGDFNVLMLEGDRNHLWISSRIDDSWLLTAFNETQFLAWSESLQHYSFQPEAGLSLEGAWFRPIESNFEFGLLNLVWPFLSSLVFSFVMVSLIFTRRKLKRKVRSKAERLKEAA